MGIISGTWFNPSFYRRRVEPGTIARQLLDATGLRIEHREDGALVLPQIHQELFGWEFEDHAVTVHAFVPAHPYLWENLDAVMIDAGATRDNAIYKWRPNPVHARLRTRWERLSMSDRLLLSLPSILASRPFDRLL